MLGWWQTQKDEGATEPMKSHEHLPGTWKTHSEREKLFGQGGQICAKRLRVLYVIVCHNPLQALKYNSLPKSYALFGL